MKYGNQRYLAEGMGAFLFAQFEQLGWPIPDMIVPVPISWLRRMDRGFNQSLLLAKELANYIDCPCEDILKRRSGDFSQAALSLEQRQGLVGDSFYLSDKANIKGKTILVIDDVLTSGSTLHRCAEALMEGVPNRLYGLTFCRTSGDS
jgi:ComF family protein